MWKPENYHKTLSPDCPQWREERRKHGMEGNLENIGKGVRSGKSNEISEGNQPICGQTQERAGPFSPS